MVPGEVTVRVANGGGWLRGFRVCGPETAMQRNLVWFSIASLRIAGNDWLILGLADEQRP